LRALYLQPTGAAFTESVDCLTTPQGGAPRLNRHEKQRAISLQIIEPVTVRAKNLLARVHKEVAIPASACGAAHPRLTAKPNSVHCYGWLRYNEKCSFLSPRVSKVLTTSGEYLRPTRKRRKGLLPCACAMFETQKKGVDACGAEFRRVLAIHPDIPAR